ncbi:MAG: 50S ribosomal protein L4 [Candidatus Marinimicrobia bacterium]|nr:50S ribosomal protein L4 [Candidatus Neomarinimicrobiota bacterium]
MDFVVYNKEGKKTDEILKIDDLVFDIEPHEHSIYLSVKSELKNLRQGTHSTKTRAEKRGGGKKPWPQKGRGVARAGSRRSPVWVGGGVVFGPKPHKYTSKINKKVKLLARRSALSLKLKDQNIKVLEDFNYADHKTKNVRNLLTNLEVDSKKILFLTSDINENFYLASRNFPNVSTLEAVKASTYTIMRNDIVLIDKDGLLQLNDCLK